MPCYHPIEGYRSKFVNAKTGKRSIVFNTNDGYRDLPVTIPCGQCIGCRLEYSRQWALRCYHESQLYDENSFLTLTYDNEHLPNDKSIHKEEIQKFFKRLRKNTGRKIRYFACGEYGSKNNRPHYHAIIFGYDFPDKYLWSIRDGNALYRSNILEKCWKLGHAKIGSVTFESAAYVARYIMKKRKGKPDQKDKDGKTNAEHYQMLDTETGEITEIQPEFCIMSRKPGIGLEWLKQYKTDTDKDYVTLRGMKMSLPKYYDNKLHELGEDIEKRKQNRLKKLNRKDNTTNRLLSKEKVKLAQINQLPRNLDEELS